MGITFKHPGVILSYLEKERVEYNGIREAVVLASKATQFVQQQADDRDHWTKDDRTPVTIADLASQVILIPAIASCAPEDGVLSEEDASSVQDSDQLARVREIVEEVAGTSVSNRELEELIQYRGNPDGEKHWVVDPLDGTKGYIRKMVYSVALARISGSRPIAGWLAVPGEHEEIPLLNNRLFSAMDGSGTHVASLSEADQVQRVVPQEYIARDDLIVTGSRAHGGKTLPPPVVDWGKPARNVPIDSQAKYAAIATGAAHLYPRIHSSSFGHNYSWDHAAGSLLVEESGGVVTDWYDKALDFSHGERLTENIGILAASREFIHEELMVHFADYRTYSIR